MKFLGNKHLYINISFPLTTASPHRAPAISCNQAALKQLPTMPGISCYPLNASLVCNIRSVPARAPLGEPPCPLEGRKSLLLMAGATADQAKAGPYTPWAALSGAQGLGWPWHQPRVSAARPRQVPHWQKPQVPLSVSSLTEASWPFHFNRLSQWPLLNLNISKHFKTTWREAF